jgi:DNA-directed RNA polymerase subunit RPC12/RpoP
MQATVYLCSECEGEAVAEHWDALSALLLRQVRLQIKQGEVDADDVWVDDEMMACPRCKFEHHDDESSWVEGRLVPIAARPLPPKVAPYAGDLWVTGWRAAAAPKEPTA